MTLIVQQTTYAPRFILPSIAKASCLVVFSVRIPTMVQVGINVVIFWSTLTVIRPVRLDYADPFLSLDDESVKFNWKDDTVFDPVEHYDFKKLVNAPPQSYVDVQEYEHGFKVDMVEGKYRGMIATEPIQPGQLILASRAFSLSRPGTKSGGMQDLVYMTVNNLRQHPEFRAQVYNLWAGDELKYLELSDNDDHPLEIEEERIKQVCKKNNFVTNIVGHDESDSPIFGRGLFIRASYANHACMGNTIWSIYGDIIFFRATKVIKEGDEILVSYEDARSSWPDRQERHEDHNFECPCALCQADKADTNAIHTIRTQLLAEFEDEVIKDEASLPILTGICDKLEVLREDAPHLNLVIFETLFKMAMTFRNLNDSSNGLKYLDKCFHLIEGTTVVIDLPHIAMHAIDLAIMANDKDAVEQWIQRFHQAVIVFYGSLDMAEQFVTKHIDDYPTSTLQSVFSRLLEPATITTTSQQGQEGHCTDNDDIQCMSSMKVEQF